MATGVGDSSTSILRVLTALPKLSTAADVGSGNGRISNHLRKLGWNVSGCEINPELALLAEVDHADARRWQPPHAVDLVTCIELIEHLPPEDQPPLLRQFRSWLRTDGILVLSSPQRHSPVAFFDRLEARRKGVEYDWWDPTHISVLPRRRLEALLTGAGFDILERCGVCFAPDAFAVRSKTCRRLRYASSTGMMARYGWNLIYTCRAV